ncbi:hypothetical protein TVAG_417830 [Trichomonas vaginalis G3]|uniref:Uncharacterized protein n=1 Tax=Trichomonas vaginalis (strain ATCC PRA-98 / G3) TaxID=412133 RepID=A2EDA3_TRIV3|nr:hypothetical protein TVAGG3_0876170 [Trichomonas vaginalis G3]EAY09361.1 hypothetical protein TVAG_417830 [Trichomonas vaginalis G3]KAI5501703.1 hypothetical protein TVAGG3_0876170 [Trichomonas vaginalis G3]|eukprot:XP_001321584.1 hypothetical protein [Trichomonas vaginalis G3]
MYHYSQQIDPRVEKSLDRMDLWPMVPLHTGTEDITPAVPSVLETKFEPFPKTYSTITANIDHIMSLDSKPQKQEFVKPFYCEHTITQYNTVPPRFDPAAPHACTYTPNFNAIKTKIQTHKIGPRRRRNNKKAFSAAEVIKEYETNIREYDIKETIVPSLTTKRSKIIEEDHKIFRTLPDEPQDRNLYTMPITINIPTRDPPPEKPTPVTVFERQPSRKPIFKEDSQRDYKDAVPQSDKIRPRSHITNLGPKEISTPKRNQRVEFLNEIKRERNDFIQELAALDHPVKRAAQTPRKGSKYSFDKQMSRKNEFLNIKKEQLGEPKLPVNPGESFKHTVPSTRMPEITPAPPPLEGVAFWTSLTRYNTNR